jgi:hypothetical protein
MFSSAKKKKEQEPEDSSDLESKPENLLTPKEKEILEIRRR